MIGIFHALGFGRPTLARLRSIAAVVLLLEVFQRNVQRQTQRKSPASTSLLTSTQKNVKEISTGQKDVSSANHAASDITCQHLSATALQSSESVLFHTYLEKANHTNASSFTNVGPKASSFDSSPPISALNLSRSYTRTYDATPDIDSLALVHASPSLCGENYNHIVLQLSVTVALIQTQVET